MFPLELFSRLIHLCVYDLVSISDPGTRKGDRAPTIGTKRRRGWVGEGDDGTPAVGARRRGCVDGREVKWERWGCGNGRRVGERERAPAVCTRRRRCVHAWGSVVVGIIIIIHVLKKIKYSETRVSFF